MSTVNVHLHRSMEAVPAAVTALRAAIADFLGEAGIGEPLLTSAKLAVSEAVTNAVMHAYVDAPKPGAVSVDATFDGDSLLVEVSDDGSGMMPRLDSPGLGVGLPLIAGTTDTLDIGNSPRGGTVLRMSFALTQGARR
jgi:serine/threonine-protein kinase RsbW/stage II sporulation protein AB (anti-sigma F factor)